jgi:hypothetical protein
MTAPAPAAPAASVLIVSGLTREAAILSGPGRLALCGDYRTLRAKLAGLAGVPFDLVVSWGLCGGLDRRLRPGDLVVGSEVVSEEGGITTEETVTSNLARRLVSAGARVSVERMAGVGAPVSTARAKAELRLATGTAAVDMESLTAGRFALELRAPFVILRAVADPADRDLPPLISSAVSADGRINAAAVAGELVRSPGQLAALAAAARDSRAAFRSLGRCRGLLPGLFLGLRPANL